MKGRTTKKILSALLSLVMLLSLLPTTVLATEGDASATWTKVELADITASDTIAITMTKGDTTWVLPTTGGGKSGQPLAVVGTVADGKLTTSGAAADYGWTISTVEGGYQIKTGQKYLYLTAANNGMRIGKTEMVWSVENGYLTAKDSSDTSRYVGVYNRTDWRCYTNTTGNTAGQALAFYKLEATGGGSGEGGDTQTVAEPTASIPSGEVTAGTQVEFSCATEGAKIYYQSNGVGDFVEYTGPITITETVAFTVKASSASGGAESSVVTFSYTVKAAEPATVTIAEALAGATGTEFTVKGVVTLVDGQNYYLQDATGGICLRLSKSTTEIALGDTVIGTGKRAVYRGLPQLGEGTFIKSSGMTLVAKTTTIDALTMKDIGTYVKITGLEITKVDDGGGKYTSPNLTLKDADGKTIQIYKAVVGKTGGDWAFKVGDKVDVTAAVGINNSTLQLRTTVAGEIVAASVIKDPISDDMIPAGVMTVKDAGAVTAATSNVSVIGQVVYHYGKNYKGNASIDSIILEDVIDGEIYGFQVYDYTNYAKYKVGDVVKVTGTIELYNNLPQMKTPTMEVVKAGVEPIPAQEITVSQMGEEFLSEYVCIKDVTLGTYSKDSNTTVTDATGKVNLFKGVPLPAGVTEADVTAVYGCCSLYNSTYQLRNGSSSDYVTNVTPPVTGGLPEAGDEVVIYSNSAKAALAAQDDAASPSIKKSGDATIENGKLTAGNGAAVFTVEANGEYLRFKNDTYGYLCANGTGNNAFYSTTASNDADWLVRTCSGGVGGFEMESRTAKYKSYSQWLEYYSDSFKVYSMDKSKVTDYTIYSFDFYPVADGVTLDGGVVNVPAVVIDKVFDAYVGQEYTLSFTVDAPFGVKSVTAKLNDTELTTTVAEGVYTVTVPVEKVTGSKLSIVISGKDNKDRAIDRTVEVTVKDEPAFSDPTPANGAQTGENKRPVISVALTNAGTAPTVTMTVGGKDVQAVFANGRVTYTPVADMADGRTEVSVTATRSDGKKATINWFFTVGTAKYQLYFGQLHSHTQYSDGAGTLDSALNYVKNLPESANVQFVAFTDHSNYFDTTGAANPEGALYDMTAASSYSQQRWKEYKDAIANFNASQSGIIAIGGFEMTWSGGPGHINTFNTPGIVSRNNSTLNNKTSDAGMKAYYALLSQAEGADSISQFNHPGTTFGNFSDFSYWDPVIDTRIHMVEVGNGEGQIGAGGYYPSYEQYIMALDKGWHLAPSNNQDNHKGKWGNANNARNVIITDDFSEQGLYEAIRAMRMYATEDKNLEIGYTVNGLMMGSSITDVPEKLNINVTVNDPDKTDTITKVEIIANSGKVVHVWDTAAALAGGNLSVELAPDYSYYFVRVTQGDGDLAVTAPVWVGESLKLGISNAVCGTATPVTGEELTLTTTLFNSESVDATVKSMSYAIKGGAVIGTDTTGYTLGKSSTKDITFKYTPDKARIMTVTITAVVVQDGKEYTFTKDVTLDVLDAAGLVYIGIDAAHYNEYVAGNYKDSMGNFGNLAAGYSVRTVQLNTSAELIAACSNSKYKALILTAPSRRLAEAQTALKTYTADELEAIAKFNGNGGTVILAGWSDNYENYDVIKNNPAAKHMAATQNELLEKLGSSLRISDDATYDDVRSAADGVDKWRLYFSTYNLEHPLLSGVIFDAEHPYDKLYTERFSHYGGASIYAVDASGNAASTLPATVSPVVYGHASTYSVDVDGDGLGGSGIPKYAYAEGDSRLLVMATEQLPNKGMIIVSGAAFMSNFEVQATISDNGAEKNYSNYRICENLVALLNPVTVTDIKTVQAQVDEGIKYTVEGIVTSNASGYDKDTAFFDCIYVQDGTAGINCFPVAGNFKVGDRVRVTGTTSSYQGERQLAVTSIEKLGDGTPVTPTEVTAAQVNNGSVLGSLIKVKGTITGIENAEGLVQTILVRDSAGAVCRAFIDGYITKDKGIGNLSVGNAIEVVGLASYDNTFTLANGTAMAPRIRIRDRADIVCTRTTSGGSGSGSSSGSVSSSNTFTTDLPAGSITRVSVNGRTLDGKYYTISGGNVTLTDAYLKSLRPGSYTIRIENATHVSTGTFTVGRSGTIVSPGTGDPGVALYVVLAVTSLSGTAWLRRRKER